MGETGRLEDAASGEDLNERFVELLRAEFGAMIVATIALATAGILAQRWGLLVICGYGLLSGAFRQLARRPAREGRLQLAAAIFAIGQWSTTLLVAALLPIALPVLVFNVVVPVLIAATYTDERGHRPFVLAAVVMSFLIAVLGLTQDGLRMEDGVDEWIVDWTIVGFLVGYTWMFFNTVRDSNRIRSEALRRALRTNAELIATQEQLRRSRRRLVEVADQERSRIERDIHDGAQQRLVSAALRLRLASQLAERGRTPTVESLDELHEEVTAALADLRDLASGVYPSLLVDRGAGPALESLGRRAAVPTRVIAELGNDVGIEISPDIHAALYFFCAEALQNAAKHAGPDAEVTIELRGPVALRGAAKSAAEATQHAQTHVVVAKVADTGVGFDPERVRTSRGMLNMADRIEALDGELHVHSEPGRGTTLVASVPVTP